MSAISDRTEKAAKALENVSYVFKTVERSRAVPDEEAIPVQAYIDRSMDAVRAQNDAHASGLLAEIRSMRADMDGQFAQIGSRLDILSSAAIDAKDAANRAHIAANAAETVARGAADVARTQNWNILMAMIAVIAVILALAGLWMTAMQTVGSLAQ